MALYGLCSDVTAGGRLPPLAPEENEKSCQISHFFTLFPRKSIQNQEFSPLSGKTCYASGNVCVSLCGKHILVRFFFLFIHENQIRPDLMTFNLMVGPPTNDA